jgi:hypothetical protein
MRYQIERANGAIEYVEADGFHVQDIGGMSSAFGGKMGGTAHYIFRNDPVERYGTGSNVAAYTDVRAVRIAPAEPKVVSKEPVDAVTETPIESIN